MASAVQDDNAAEAEYDEIDDLFNLDNTLDDIFHGRKTKDGAARAETSQEKPGAAEGLGIDEEITIKKKRQPVAKLDVTRLLTPAGIPKLRKTKLKFRGKGHEFSDVALLLKTYQLWLDDLYPRAKFGDGLSMIEKLGHTRQISMLRRQWIDESKPGFGRDELDEILPEADTNATVAPAALEKLDENTTREKHTEPEDTSDLAKETDALQLSSTEETGNGPDDDELDALLAEESMKQDEQPGSIFGAGASTSKSKPRDDDMNEFADEEALLAEMEGGWD